MTAERTPLAVLMTALGDTFPLPSPVSGASNAQPAPTPGSCSQKKRKRTVACGQCDACGRDDCGRCLNCLDKPKFGGQGIRKQSCLERKCRFPTSATITTITVSQPSSSSATPKLTPEASASAPPTKDRQEWDEFWGAVECCMRLQRPAELQHMSCDDRFGNKKVRTARCGACNGCVRGDCGECKNCLDKPKFGGRGIKKQACLQRVCHNPQEEDESPGPSPRLKPSKASGLPPSGFNSTDTTPKLSVLVDTATSDRVEPPPLELPEPSPVAKPSTRVYTKKVSFADEQPGADASAAEPMAYSTDDEEEPAQPPPTQPKSVLRRDVAMADEEQSRQERQIWGAALANRAALASPLATPMLPPLLSAAASAAAPAPTTATVVARPAPAYQVGAHDELENQRRIPSQVLPAERSEREAGAAEALVMAGCGESSHLQLPLMLLLSASNAR